MNLQECNQFLKSRGYNDQYLSGKDKKIIKIINDKNKNKYNNTYLKLLPNDIKNIIINLLYPHTEYVEKTLDSTSLFSFSPQELSCIILKINSLYYILECIAVHQNNNASRRSGRIQYNFPTFRFIISDKDYRLLHDSNTSICHFGYKKTIYDNLYCLIEKYDSYYLNYPPNKIKNNMHLSEKFFVSYGVCSFHIDEPFWFKFYYRSNSYIS